MKTFQSILKNYIKLGNNISNSDIEELILDLRDLQSNKDCFILRVNYYGININGQIKDNKKFSKLLDHFLISFCKINKIYLKLEGFSFSCDYQHNSPYCSNEYTLNSKKECDIVTTVIKNEFKTNIINVNCIEQIFGD